MRNVIVFMMLALAGCKKASVAADEWRPPVLEGKCVVDRYFDHQAYDQWCDFAGYLWKCGPQDCVRTGESKGERPALVVPVPAQPAPVPPK